jgi:hypothetical protein
LVCILAIFCYVKIKRVEKIEDNKQKVILIDSQGEGGNLRTTPNFLFNDYENLDRKMSGQRTIEEIKAKEALKNDNGIRVELITENFSKFPELAGYYLPINIIDATSSLDIDKDGKLEELVYYSCPGCNAPSRNVDIIKDGRIIFSAHGGSLELKNNNEDKPGFVLSDVGLVLPRPEGYTEIKFRLNSDSEYVPYEERDIRYSAVTDDAPANAIPTSVEEYFSATNAANAYFENNIKENYQKNGVNFSNVYDYASSSEENEKLEVNSGKYLVKITTNGLSGEPGSDFDYEVSLLNNQKIVTSKNISGSKPVGIYQIKYGTDKIINFVQDWTGGAHCCFSLTSVLSSGTRIFFGGNLYRGDSDVVAADSFFIKDDKLYFYTYNTDFAYFESSYVGSQAAFIPVIYRIDDSGKFILATMEFKNIYSEMAKIVASGLDIKKNNNIIKDKEMVLPELIYWLQASLIADNKEAWSQFENYYNNFTNNEPGYSEVKQKIKNSLLNF